MEVQPQPPNAYDGYAQEYAKGGISAAILLNGGASVALLSQLGKLIELGLQTPAAIALGLWTTGIMLAALTWVIAIASARHVSRSYSPFFIGARELRISDRWMCAGITTIILSVALFAIGAGMLAYHFASSATPHHS